MLFLNGIDKLSSLITPEILEHTMQNIVQNGQIWIESKTKKFDFTTPNINLFNKLVMINFSIAVYGQQFHQDKIKQVFTYLNLYTTIKLSLKYLDILAGTYKIYIPFTHDISQITLLSTTLFLTDVCPMQAYSNFKDYISNNLWGGVNLKTSIGVGIAAGKDHIFLSLYKKINIFSLYLCLHPQFEQVMKLDKEMLKSIFVSLSLLDSLNISLATSPTSAHIKFIAMFFEWINFISKDNIIYTFVHFIRKIVNLYIIIDLPIDNFKNYKISFNIQIYKIVITITYEPSAAQNWSFSLSISKINLIHQSYDNVQQMTQPIINNITT